MWMFGVYLSFLLGGWGREGDQKPIIRMSPNPKFTPQAQQTESNQIVRSLLLTKKSKVKASRGFCHFLLQVSAGDFFCENPWGFIFFVSFLFWFQWFF